MRRLLIFGGLLLIISQGQAQTKENRLKDPWVYEAMDKGLTEKRIFVQFIVEPSGEIPDDSVKALNSFFGLEKVAEKAVIDAPDYKYTKNTKPSDKNEKFVIPIQFKFENFTKKDWSEFHKIKGQKLIELGDNNGAKKELEESIKLNKKNGESYHILGQIWKDENKIKSEKYFEEAAKYGFQK